ncbi:MAG: hypothetical protein WCF81_24900, partial [Roseiarcus sp.]
ATLRPIPFGGTIITRFGCDRNKNCESFGGISASKFAANEPHSGVIRPPMDGQNGSKMGLPLSAFDNR